MFGLLFIDVFAHYVHAGFFGLLLDTIEAGGCL
jgi:hypothetical protein